MPTRLLITLAFPPNIGGMQTFAYMRCQAQAGEVVVLAPQVQGWESFDAGAPLRIYRWSSSFSHVPAVKRLLQLLLPLLHAVRIHRSEGFDIIECWQPLPFGLIGLVFKALYGVPYIVWSHGNDLSRPARYPLGRKLLERVIAGARLVVANSENTKRALLALGIPPGKIRVLNPPVDLRRFSPDDDSLSIRRNHRLEGKRVILTVARLVRVKGIDTVIKALPSILKALPNVAYVVVGDGPLRAELEQLARQLGVSDHVLFVGAIDYLSDELPKYYKLCDVFVMVSRPFERREEERFGLVYLEAGACGKPVIAGRGGGTAEAVEENVTGLLVDPWDPEDVAQAVIRLLTNRDLGQRMGMAGRQRALKEPPWEYLRLD